MGSREADGALRARPARSTSSRWPTTTTTSTPTTRSTTRGTRSASVPRGTSSAPGRRSPAPTACGSASATTRPTAGTGSRPPTATTPKVRWPASATTRTGSRRRTARANGGRASIRRSSTPAGTSSCPTASSSAKAVADWHEKNDRPWTEKPPPTNPAFVEKWFLRCKDLVDKYHPDLLYFDNIGELPLGQAGLDIAAHLYNTSLAARRRPQAVLNVKGIDAARRPALVEDYERGASDVIQPAPWQTDTCIGEWHYRRSLFDEHRYKTVAQVVHMLVNIVSKNGNLLLSIPVRGDGTIDEDEVAFLEGMAAWMRVHGEGIFGTRPWKVAGEGPTQERRRHVQRGPRHLRRAGRPLHDQGRHALRVPARLARGPSCVDRVAGRRRRRCSTAGRSPTCRCSATRAASSGRRTRKGWPCSCPPRRRASTPSR